MKEEPIRVLQVLPCLQAAGVENYTMNLYRNIDRAKVQFDFLVHSKKKFAYDDEVTKLGGKIYRLSLKDDKNFVKYWSDLNTFFKNHPEYKIVHGEMQSMMPVYLKAAKKNNVPVRIAHAHNGDYEKTAKGFVLHILSRLAGNDSTLNLACSDLAGKYLFGKKSYKFAPNAIDVKRFKFSESARKVIRKDFDINANDILIGNIGRFDLQKNHKFIVDVFVELTKDRPDTKLMLVGDGRLRQEIQQYVDDMGLRGKVIFAGIREDTQSLLSAMDVFFMPSLYEGLPVSGVEAQCSGLKCVMSDTITNEVNITNRVTFLNLNEPKKKWANALLENLAEKSDRINMYKQIEGTDFDIKKSAKDFENMYVRLYKENA